MFFLLKKNRKYQLYLWTIVCVFIVTHNGCERQKDIYSPASWPQSLGGDSADITCSIQQNTDGDYIIAGYSSSDDGNSGNHGARDYWIVKLNSFGDL